MMHALVWICANRCSYGLKMAEVGMDRERGTLRKVFVRSFQVGVLSKTSRFGTRVHNMRKMLPNPDPGRALETHKFGRQNSRRHSSTLRIYSTRRVRVSLVPALSVENVTIRDVCCCMQQ